MKITILCENSIGKRVGAGEHGFSAFIETEEGSFLFDTGSGPSNGMGTLPLGAPNHSG
jgi:7,8-dihydropterin-6-yl-methyl-4-(beta-D-ribofuranosyl)aminobenzene 5'-phosphate synthase